MLITLTSLADHRLRLPKAGPAGGTLWDPTRPRQDAVGSPKHAARTLIRHSDRRTMRTTQATDLHPRRIPEVSHETKNATRLHTYTMGDDARPHATLTSPPKAALVGPRSHEPRPPWPGWFIRAAVTPGYGGSRQTPRPWSISPSPRARRQRRRPYLQHRLHHHLLASLLVQGTCRGAGSQHRPRVVGPALCMMQPSRTSLVRACLRDSCPPAWAWLQSAPGV